MAAYDVTKIELGRAEVTFNSAVLGYSESVSVKVSGKFVDIKTAQTGELVLDKRWVGGECMVEAIFAESQIAVLKQPFPWYSSGTIPIFPAAMGQSMYALAQALKVHPLEKGVATLEDYNFVKAVPLGEYEVKYDGKQKGFKVVYYVFADQAQLPGAVSAGAIG